MAQRRMIGKQIQGSDAFRGLSLGAQALYSQLILEADDDGFVASPNSIIAACPRIKIKHYTELVSKRFLIGFESGVVCIKHWLMLNSIKKDRYVPTVYIKERESLAVKANKAYTEKDKSDPIWNHNGTTMEPKCFRYGSVDKDRIDKDSIDKIDPRACACEEIDRSPSEAELVFSYYRKFYPSCSFEIPQEKILDFLRRHSVEDFKALLKKAEKSGYLSGRTGAPVMKLEWALEEENYLSVLSGKYDSWKEEPEKAEASFDSEEFFEAAVARGRKGIGS